MKTNRSMSHVRFGIICTLLLALALAGQAQTPRFQINASTDRGGGVGRGGVFTLNGTLGQSEVGSATNGIYAVAGGFWAVEQTANAPVLSIERLVDGSVRVFWPRPGTGFLLDEQGAASNGVTIPWAQVTVPYLTNTTHISITLATPTGNRIFRLRKP
jgi:hypothetical protein